MEEYAVKFTKEIEYVAIGLSPKYVPTNRIWVSYKDELRKGSLFLGRACKSF